MNKTYFDIKNLLDGFVSSFIKQGRLQTIGAMVNPNLSGICHGSNEEILNVLSKIVNLYSTNSNGIFIAVEQFDEQMSLKFTLKFYFEENKLPQDLSGKRVDSLIEYNFTNDCLILSYLMSVDVKKFKQIPKRKLFINVLSDATIKSLVLKDQLQCLGHNCEIVSTENISSDTFDSVDIVLVDEAFNRDQFLVSDDPSLIGIGKDHAFKKKTAYPVYISDFEKNIQTEAIMRVLIVDDSLPSLQITSLMMQNLGYQTTCVETALEALEVMAVNKFEILLTDIHLEGISGIELIHKVRQGNFNLQRILAMTGSSETDLHTRVLKAGADNLLIKPLRKKQLAYVLDSPEDEIISSTEFN